MSRREQSNGVATRRRRPAARTIVALAIGGLLVLFAALNSQSVTIHWLVTTTETPLIIVIAGTGLLGFAIGWLAARRSARNRRG
jgi:uncharacterized integral membrane protein